MSNFEASPAVTKRSESRAELALSASENATEGAAGRLCRGLPSVPYLGVPFGRASVGGVSYGLA